jgi:hypothetical protein
LKKVKVAVLSAKSHDAYFLTETARRSAHEFSFFEDRLMAKTAGIAAGFEVVRAFVNDLNRKCHPTFNRVREGNFGIDELLGFDLHGSAVGIVGVGRIGLLNTWSPIA